MNPTRFDNLSKLLATRLSRRGALRLGGAGALASLATGLWRLPTHGQSTPPSATSQLPSGLAADNATYFLQTATGGTFAPNPAATPGGTPAAGAVRGAYRLTLTGHAGETLAVVDQPVHEVAALTTPRFFATGEFPGGTEGPPAALALGSGPADQVVGLTLYDPVYDAASQTLTYGADLLPVGSRAMPRTAGTQVARAPATFAQSALVVGDCQSFYIGCDNRCPSGFGNEIITYGNLSDTPYEFCFSLEALLCQPCHYSWSTLSQACANKYPSECRRSDGCLAQSGTKVALNTICTLHFPSESGIPVPEDPTPTPIVVCPPDEQC